VPRVRISRQVLIKAISAELMAILLFFFLSLLLYLILWLLARGKTLLYHLFSKKPIFLLYPSIFLSLNIS